MFFTSISQVKDETTNVVKSVYVISSFHPKISGTKAFLKIQKMEALIFKSSTRLYTYFYKIVNGAR